jgi:hypothetical protein
VVSDWQRGASVTTAQYAPKFRIQVPEQSWTLVAPNWGDMNNMTTNKTTVGIEHELYKTKTIGHVNRLVSEGKLPRTAFFVKML